MLIALLSARIDNLKVTSGSYAVPLAVGIDGDIVEKAGIKDYQEIRVYNRKSGKSVTGYAVSLPEGSGRVELDSASFGAEAGDVLVISAFSYLPEKDLGSRDINIVHVDENNAIARVSTGKI